MLWVKNGVLFDGVLLMGDRRIWIDGEPDPMLMLRAGYSVYDPYSEDEGGVAVSPYGFSFSDMTQTADGYTIIIPRFVVAVENDVTGTVICDIQHNSDGTSTLLFTNTDTEWFTEAEDFTAYTLTKTDGGSIPMREKTEL